MMGRSMVRLRDQRYSESWMFLRYPVRSLVFLVFSTNENILFDNNCIVENLSGQEDRYRSGTQWPDFLSKHMVRSCSDCQPISKRSLKSQVKAAEIWHVRSQKAAKLPI